MQIEIDTKKSVEENAAKYFEAAKKAKKKINSIKKVIDESRKKLSEMEAKKEREIYGIKEIQRKKEEKKKRKHEWFEKFRWFYSSEGFLCVGGRDATTNDILVKKHLEKDDIVFHTETAGSPFFIVKQGQKCREATKQEAAEATALYSKQFKLGSEVVDVYWINPKQVSISAKSGEHMAKGSFMIYGKRNYMTVSNARVAVGIKKSQIIGGPAAAIAKNAEKMAVLQKGDKKPSEIAKLIQKKIGGEIDEIIKFLPAVNLRVF